MKPQPTIRQKTILLIMSLSMLLIGCGSFETVSSYNDGIYGDEATAHQKPKTSTNGNYYKKYFDEKIDEADQDSVLFTDPAGYSNTQVDEPDNTQQQAYGNWGDQTDQINITINGYSPYQFSYSPYYNYQYWDVHYRPWWRHRYRPWRSWSYYHYPSYYYSWYHHYNPHYYGHYPYHYPTYYNSYYRNYGNQYSGVIYSKSKGRRGSVNTASPRTSVSPRSVSEYSYDSSTETSSSSRRYESTSRDVSGREYRSASTNTEGRSTSNFMNRDYSNRRISTREDRRKTVSAGRSNNNGSNYQVRSYRPNSSNNRAIQSGQSSKYTSQRSQSNYSPSYKSSSSRSSAPSYSSGRSSSRSSSSARSSSGSTRSSSSGRR